MIINLQLLENICWFSKVIKLNISNIQMKQKNKCFLLEAKLILKLHKRKAIHKVRNKRFWRFLLRYINKSKSSIGILNLLNKSYSKIKYLMSKKNKLITWINLNEASKRIEWRIYEKRRWILQLLKDKNYERMYWQTSNIQWVCLRLIYLGRNSIFSKLFLQRKKILKLKYKLQIENQLINFSEVKLIEKIIEDLKQSKLLQIMRFFMHYKVH